jgi:hypothetical protein
VLRTFIVCVTVIFALIIFAVGSKFKWFSSITIGKTGIDVKAAEIKAAEIVEKKEKEKEQKQFESGNLNKLLDDQIIKCDIEAIDFALAQSNKLRRTLNNQLNHQVPCSGTRRSLAACLRYPLYEASRKNNFKEVLRPENAKEYINKILKEVKEEYQAFAIEMEMSFCPTAADSSIKCPELPPLDSILGILNDALINNWLLPIRQKIIETCEKKIKLYNDFLLLYEELGDNNRIKITKLCIEKNMGYIKALSRKPEPGEL